MATQRREKSGEAAEATELPLDSEPAPGEITGPAQDTLRGDSDAAAQLFALTAPHLRDAARRHLQNLGDRLNLSPDEIAKMTIQAFIGTADFDLQSRQDFFDYADRVAEGIIRCVAGGGDETLLPDASKKGRRSTALGQAIHEIRDISSDLAHLLRFRYVLEVGPEAVASLSGQPRATVRKSWATAEALLEAKYKEVTTRATARPRSLDKTGSQVYPEAIPLIPADLASDSPPPAAPEDIGALQEENARLRSELAEALERVTTLEAQVATMDLDSAPTRADLDTLLSPPDLTRVPLFSGTTSEELFRHLERHYSQWLVHFGATHNAISLDQIRRHDPSFVQKLSHRISRIRRQERQRSGEPQTPTLGEMMPTEEDRGDVVLAGRTVEELFDPANREIARRVSSRLIRLLYRQ